MTEDRQTAEVILQPMNRVLRVSVGSLLLTVLHDAGILVESICGGKGLCRKCRVILTRGECGAVRKECGHGMSPEEEAAGHRYACQVRITDDCEFIIPVESRIDAPKILLSACMEVGECEPVIARYPVLREGPPDMPVSKRSLRLGGYTGPRPDIPESLYRDLLEADSPLVATVSTARDPPEIIAVEPAGTPKGLYGVALDLGTTTVVGCLVDLAGGEILESSSALNRQITYGEELITRIGYARTREGRSVLQAAATGSLNAVIDEVASRGGVRTEEIMDITIGANTVMNHLLTGTDTAYLELANALVSRHPILVNAAELHLATGKGASVYCLPNVSRFVGGDAVGDVIAAGMHVSDDLSLLIDMGTNGEIILGNREWLASVSCASGPAFEGGGLSCGMRAMRGAIEHIRIDPGTGEIALDVIGGGPALGICGSGIIDAGAAMAVAGVLDFAGKLKEDRRNVRRSGEGLEYLVVPADRTGTGRDIVITQKDIDYLMDSKAATCGAIAVLLKKYKVAVGDVRHVYLAGAFGMYVSVGNLVRFGIIPDFYHAAIHQIGNGSLSGAYAVLVSRAYRNAAEEVAEKMVYIDLLVDMDFIEEYSAALYIPGKSDLFPRHLS